MRVLLVEDEDLMADFLLKLFEKNRFVVKIADNLKKAEEILRSNDFDIIILDRNFPNEKDGLEICKNLRIQGSDVPILVLSARGESIDKVEGLKFGADDYLEKPYNVQEFLARVNALLRRGRKKILSNKVGEFTLDDERGEIFFKKQKLDLKLKEFQLLQFFLRNRSRIITETEILENIWNDDQFMTKSNTVNVHLMRLRKQLKGESKKFLKTIRGRGFMFDYA